MWRNKILQHTTAAGGWHSTDADVVFHCNRQPGQFSDRLSGSASSVDLIGLFKRSVGLTPHTYLTQVRLGMACQRLRQQQALESGETVIVGVNDYVEDEEQAHDEQYLHIDPDIDAKQIGKLAGANAEVQAEWLVQFAQMGSIYARQRFGIEAPTVGLLSIGEEPGKGDTLRKEAFELLSAASGIQFIGNVEGRDLMKKTADVIVTDGFTGNVALKTLEGGLKVLFSALLEAFGSDPSYKPHADALLPALLPLHAQMSPDTYGGAVLLGVDGICIISHGSSGQTAIVNACKLAAELVRSDLVGAITAAFTA